jgi:hypothetical protein
MTATPAAILTIVAVDLAGGALLALVALVVARTALPRLEAWFARTGLLVGGEDDVRLPRAARERARSLFLAHLTPAQRRSWSIRRRVPIVASSGRRYLLAPYRPYNVRSGDALFCLQVDGLLPAYDKLLAQTLLLESDESFFLARANVRTFSRAWDVRIAAARHAYPPPQPSAS